MSKYLVSEKLGPRMSVTTDGFLLCEGTPIARTGLMIYGPRELPVDVGPDGVVRVERSAEDFFTAETIASFQGKPVVDDHPDGMVTPKTWADVAVGVTLNVRRGTGIEDHLLLADLLITKAEAIEAVRSGKREVSCGYDADYDEIGIGRARQYNCVGNHVALVEEGRCGSTCAIRDHKTVEDPRMSKRQKWFDRLRKAIAAKDEAGMQAALTEGESMDELASPDTENPNGAATHVHVHLNSKGQEGGETRPAGGLPGTGESLSGGAAVNDDGAVGGGEAHAFDDATEARFASLEKGHAEIKSTLHEIAKKIGLEAPAGTGDAEAPGSGEGAEPDKEIEGRLREEAPPGTNDAAIKSGTRDSALLTESFAETVALAEMLAPGIQLPTFDAKAAAKVTLDASCRLRRAALKAAMTNDNAAIVGALHTTGEDIEKMTCGAVRALFTQAGRMVRINNATRVESFDASVVDRGNEDAAPSNPQNIEALQKRFDAYWSGRVQ